MDDSEADAAERQLIARISPGAKSNGKRFSGSGMAVGCIVGLG
jgi:hypothetical protein